MLAIFLIVAFFSATAKSSSIPVSSFQRLEATHGGNCLHVFYKVCDPPEACKVEFTAKFEDGSSTVKTSAGKMKPTITPDNSSYVFCMYDLTSSINASCCKYNLSMIQGYGISRHDYISFQVEMCIVQSNVSSFCGTGGWQKFVVPSKNPCLLEKPCRNFGTCSPAPNDYNCTCRSDGLVTGKNCDVPKNYIKLSNQCLMSNESIATKINQTILECAAACDVDANCNSMEFTRISSDSDIGDCVLRKATRSTSATTQCLSDYFEMKTGEKPTADASRGTASVQIIFALISLGLGFSV
ncbi:uncharacterized protein LOC116605646 [Nematostella vectensis]|uniref:uncharacterized protein LOC116605646 n=1 Tax=Nematostella vectensis TaxID=45351 RepID=UPI002076D625|nr:uncharacterized protein LOC116605646 [Nematostella vectensis]